MLVTWQQSEMLADKGCARASLSRGSRGFVVGKVTSAMRCDSQALKGLVSVWGRGERSKDSAL